MSTTLCKEIGGFFQLDCRKGGMYHQDVLALNSARNALRYIVRNLDIKKILVPYYTCPVVWQTLESEGCGLVPYDVDDTLLPCVQSFEIPLLYTNYFGLCSGNITYLKQHFSTMIMDNAQAFFALPEGVAACFYSPRKFFGLPDGGLAFPQFNRFDCFEDSYSWDRCSHLLKRWDLGANLAYEDFQKNDLELDNRSVLGMSKLTRALMGNINYESVRNQRRSNFQFLHSALQKDNLLNVQLGENDVPMVYPFRTKDLSLRSKLIKNKIFVATYWPQIDGNNCMSSMSAQALSKEILPLPIDQRYDETDMQRILEVLYE